MYIQPEEPCLKRVFWVGNYDRTIPKTISEMENVRIAKQVGECSLRNGEVAVVTVAGGDGTRLGCNGPKGTLPIAPVSGKSIFQLHAEKICAIQQRYHTNIPWYIMTSKTNSLPTQDFFKAHHYFGLNSGQIRFFTQGMLPVLDLNGKLLMNSKSNHEEEGVGRPVSEYRTSVANEGIS